MKDCKECEFFEGYDYSDGTPKCTYTENGGNGYEYCPYNDQTNVKKNGIEIKIDAGFMHDYIRHTMENTISAEAYSVARQEIKSLVDEDIKRDIKNEMSKQISSVVTDAITAFMDTEITIGGGWREPERKLTRTQYLSEVIEKELENRFKTDALREYAEREIKNAIASYDRKLRDEINAGIKTYFDAATRQILSENVVTMLMCSDTYKKLSDSMQTFLPTKKGGAE